MCLLLWTVQKRNQWRRNLTSGDTLQVSSIMFPFHVKNSSAMVGVTYTSDVLLNRRRLSLVLGGNRLFSHHLVTRLQILLFRLGGMKGHVLHVCLFLDFPFACHS